MASYSTNDFRGGLKVMLDGDPVPSLKTSSLSPAKAKPSTV